MLDYLLLPDFSVSLIAHRDQLVKAEKQNDKPEAANSSALLEETTETLASDLAKARRTCGANVLTLSVIC